MGGIIGGPPGIVVGLAGGALFGRHNALEDVLGVSRQQLEDTQQQNAALDSNLSRLETQLQRHQQIRLNRLRAIVDGFSLDVPFRTESDQLEDRYLKQLDRLADSLRAFPELTIQIDAFTDVRGEERFNKRLSEKRALTVQSRLVLQGIESSRIHRIPHGEGSSDYSTQDIEGMAFDRRVRIYFTMDNH